jgi:hypothetical protein
MFCTTNRLYVKNFLVFLLPFLLLSLAACGGSGSSGGSSDVGKTAAIEMDQQAESRAAQGKSTWIEAQLTDSTGNPVDVNTRVVFRTNIGSFNSSKDQKEKSIKTADESGVVRVTLHAPDEKGRALVEAESNGVSQQVEIRFRDPNEALKIELTLGSSSIVADGTSRVAAMAVVRDQEDFGVIDKEVNFTTTAGTLIPTSDITDVTGTAKVWLQS